MKELFDVLSEDISDLGILQEASEGPGQGIRVPALCLKRLGPDRRWTALAGLRAGFGSRRSDLEEISDSERVGIGFFINERMPQASVETTGDRGREEGEKAVICQASISDSDAKRQEVGQKVDPGECLTIAVESAQNRGMRDRRMQC